MSGTHDFDLLLRDRLVQYMETHKDRLKKAWKAERLRTDKIYGIESEDPKLDTVSDMERCRFVAGSFVRSRSGMERDL